MAELVLRDLEEDVVIARRRTVLVEDDVGIDELAVLPPDAARDRHDAVEVARVAAARAVGELEIRHAIDRARRSRAAAELEARYALIPARPRLEGQLLKVGRQAAGADRNTVRAPGEVLGRAARISVHSQQLEAMRRPGANADGRQRERARLPQRLIGRRRDSVERASRNCSSESAAPTPSSGLPRRSSRSRFPSPAFGRHRRRPAHR